ncbi:alanine/glycine:cation symporter family protein [Kordiimonas aestuarii]|uniref:alanine/glycine:cation symporter family protein n=1 Tax=Kordiimonas aestuarii TaxID=1005925 RepID=UPI0021CECF6E|nr:alanine/glycine:cation symporter family protein [Kordiimonas aestuarii]
MSKCKYWLAVSLLAFSSPALAQADSASDRGGFIGFLVDIINGLDSIVFMSVDMFGADIKPIVIWMGAPMVLLTLYFGFVNLTSFGRAWRVARGDYHDPEADGEVTQFQALSTALSGTVGLGNIAGVAAAISIGGPGATFWMIIIGLCAMSLKFAECTLGVKYRVVHNDGTVSGGPMYYLKNGLAKRGWRRTGLILGWSYALLALPALLQVASVNQIYEAITVVTHADSTLYQWIFGVMLAALTAVVIMGGIRSIASVTAKLVPLMALIYISAALVIILGHIDQLPAAFATIIAGAMNPEGIAGGMLGVIVIGMQRAVYSTEAGLGSATMAHAAAKTNEPMSEGMVALMEPFIDTVVICTMTALVIVITGVYQGSEGVEGVTLTASAFGSVISWFPWVLAVAAFMFGFSTIISWGYYSGKIWEFIFGGSKSSMTTYKIVYCTAIIPGAVLTLNEVYTLMSSLFFLMAIPNIIGIYLMAPELKSDLKSYLFRLRTGQVTQRNRA